MTKDGERYGGKVAGSRRKIQIGVEKSYKTIAVVKMRPLLEHAKW